MTTKLSFALFVALLPAAAADQPAAKPAAKPTAAPTAKPTVRAAQPSPKALEMPAGAVETDPGTFRYTDAQGRKWIYRKTPFGVARMEDGAATAAPAVAAREEAVKVVENGDRVHFERPGPFGLYQWDRKKSELTDAERGWLEQARARVASRETAR